MFDSRKGLSSNFDCTSVCTFKCPTGYYSLTVTPSSATLPVGSTQQFTATEAYGDCYGTLSYYNVTFGATWSSGNSSVCTVKAAGVATAQAPGSATITATHTDSKPKWFVADQVCNDNYITKSASGTATVTPAIAVVTQRTSLTVSADNAAKAEFFSKEGTTNLGPIIGTGPIPGCFGAFEAVGTIAPSTYTGTVVLHRQFISDGVYTNSTQTGGSTTPSDDTSDPLARDDDPQSGGSAGKVYDLDAPGTGTTAPPGTNIYRYRGNFYEYAALPDGTKISSNYNFYVRVSCKKTASGYQFVNDVANDNQIGPGTTPTTWNLQ